MGFHVGDRVRIVYSDSLPQWIGRETEISAILGVGKSLSGPPVMRYSIACGVPEKYINTWAEYCFRKIGDDDDRASWERIEEIMGWNPLKQSERV